MGIKTFSSLENFHFVFLFTFFGSQDVIIGNNTQRSQDIAAIIFQLSHSLLKRTQRFR